MIDFSISPELEATRQRTTAFMNEFVYPNESRMVEDEGLPADLELDLQRRVKALDDLARDVFSIACAGLAPPSAVSK